MITNQIQNEDQNQNQSLFQEDNLFSPFHISLQFPQLSELKKDTENINSIQSISIPNRQHVNETKPRQNFGFIFRFFKILQKKNQIIKENRKKLSFINSVYSERILKQEFIISKIADKYIIDPKSKISILYQYMKFILVLSLLVVITFQWSFSDFDYLQNFNIVIYLTFAFIIDFMLQINIAIIIKGQIIFDRRIILKEHLIKNFSADIFFTLSLPGIVETQHIIFIFIMQLIGIHIMFQILRRLENLLDLSIKYTELFKLIKLLFQILLLAHIIACIWFYVGKNTIDYDNNWLDSKGIRNQTQFICYVYSFYWSVVTMVTVGFGDITPQNYLEMIVCVFIMLLSCGAYAYSLGVIGQIVQTLNLQTDQLEKNIRVINKYFKQHNIDEKLQSRIKNYLEFKILEEDQQQIENVYSLLNELPSRLKQKLISTIFQQMIQYCPILYENFSNFTLQKSSHQIKFQIFEIHECIINQYTQNDNALYFIDQGTVQLYEQSSKTVIQEFKSGQFFGEFEFFTNQQALFSVKCKTRTSIFKLTREDFINYLNDDEFQIFHKIKHRLEFSLPIKQQECYICKQTDHLIHNCNKIFYRPDMKQLYIRQENIKQFRQPHIRFSKHENCLKNIHHIQEKQIDFYQDYQQEMSQKIEFYTNEDSVQQNQSISNFSVLYNHFKIQENRDNNPIKDMSSKEQIKTKSKISQILDDAYQKQTPNQTEKTFRRPSLEFDKMKIYDQYFNECNYDGLIKKYNRRDGKKQIRKKQKQSTSKTLRYIEQLRY